MPRSAVSPNKEVQSTRSLLKSHGFRRYLTSLYPRCYAHIT